VRVRSNLIVDAKIRVQVYWKFFATGEPDFVLLSSVLQPRVQVQATINDMELDANMLIQLTCGRVVCSLVQSLLERIDRRLRLVFRDTARRHYSHYAFKHAARIDLPTFMDPSVSQQLNAVSLRYEFCTSLPPLDGLLHSVRSILALFTQVSVLVTILREQGISSPLSLLTCLCHLVVWVLSKMGPADSLEGLC